MQALLKKTLLKSASIKLAVIILLLTCANHGVLAQQDKQTTSTKEVVKPESNSDANAKTKVPEIQLPISLLLQHKNDLKHYLSADKIKPLLAGPDDYITLVTENSTVNHKGTMVLLPDWQQGATSPKAINFLRKKLPQQGWTTVTVQPASKPDNYPSKALKVDEQQKENKALIDEYKIKFTSMINAVLSIANEYPGIVVIVTQGNHGAILVDLLDEKNSHQVNSMPNAVILLSSYILTNNELINDENTDFAKKIAYSEYPILDLYLRYDHPIALEKTAQRLAVSKQEMKVYYRQRQLNNNDMGYYPEKELMIQINSWLKSIGW